MQSRLVDYDAQQTSIPSKGAKISSFSAKRHQLTRWIYRRFKRAALAIEPMTRQIKIADSADVSSFRIDGPGTSVVVDIGPGCSLKGRAYLTDGARLVIGKDTSIQGAVFHLHEGSEVLIGSGCLLSNAITFRPSDAHKIYDRTTGSRINSPEPIVIGDKVWIGENVHILKGTVIPDGCVVSSMSRVSGVFTEPHCIIGGSPARVLRSNVDWEP